MFKTFLIVKQDVYTEEIINVVFVEDAFLLVWQYTLRSAVYITIRSGMGPCDCDVSCVGTSQKLK
jgi:hypothetical protein